jgi:hypothetical protein
MFRKINDAYSAKERLLYVQYLALQAVKVGGMYSNDYAVNI